MHLEKQTKKVIEACQSVAQFISYEQKSFTPEKAKIKAEKVHDLVTYVDVESEKRLIAALSQIEPSAGFISEETNHNYKQGLNWIIDPIDGTTNFVQGVPNYAISVALAHDSEILIAVVFDVAHNSVFYTWQNAPSYFNNEVIQVSKKEDINQFLVATGFSVKDNSRLDQNLEILKYWIVNTRGIRRLGSAALDLCYVAKGVFDMYYETNLSAWDVAAGILIVKNAGGIVSDFKGGDSYLFGQEILVSNGKIHKQLVGQIKKMS